MICLLEKRAWNQAMFDVFGMLSKDTNQVISQFWILMVGYNPLHNQKIGLSINIIHTKLLDFYTL
jgi:hypothetical protein